MNSRQRNIMNIFKKKSDWVKGHELSHLLGVSDRTIRMDIESINIELGSVIESNTRKGYRVIKNHGLKEVINGDLLPQNPEERTIHIIRELLFQKNGVSVDKLLSELYISEHTLLGDIKRIRKLIESYSGIHMVKSKNTLQFRGHEAVKRRLYKDLLSNEIKEDFINLNTIASYYTQFNLVQVTKILNKILEDNSYEIKDNSKLILILHIGIIIDRLLLGCSLPCEVVEEKSQEVTVEEKISLAFFQELKKELPISINQMEVKEVAAYIRANQFIQEYSLDMLIEEDYEAINQVISKIIHYLNESFAIDFAHNSELIEGLKLHLKSLLLRVRRNSVLSEDFLIDIKQNYPFIFEMAIHVSRIISRALKIEMNEYEAGFIAIHLGAAYQRDNISSKYKVVLISPIGSRFREIAVDKLLFLYGNRIDIIADRSYFEKSEISHLNVDLIITFTDINHTLDIPTVKISTFINTEDETSVFQVINQLDRRKKKLSFTQSIISLIDQRVFYSNLEIRDKDELLQFMYQGMLKHGFVDDSFYDLVIERENLFPTSFENGIATPHPIHYTGTRSAISIATLQKPIVWGQYKVRLVILLSIAPGDQKILEIFFDWLSETIFDREQMNQICTIKTRKEFTAKIMEDN